MFTSGIVLLWEITNRPPFNYVHFCCLLLHAVSGPLRVAHLLRNMARKYPRLCVSRGVFTVFDIHETVSCMWCTRINVDIGA